MLFFGKFSGPEKDRRGNGGGTRHERPMPPARPGFGLYRLG
jgi:hypothetical protein